MKTRSLDLTFLYPIINIYLVGIKAQERKDDPMNKARQIENVYTGKPTLEGAGVRLKRIFGFHEVPAFDPFLMLDDFGSSDPGDYIAGFPWHPHRGIETVTYMLHGTVNHGDSMGNEGQIGDGQVQWMTAGSGIIHQEMPQRQKDYLRGLQLWVNLPASHKMMKPRYQDIKAAEIPEHQDKSGARIKVVAGRYKNAQGPVKDIMCRPEYLDIVVPSGKEFKHIIKEGYTVFVFILEGDGLFDLQKTKIASGQLGLYGDGHEVVVVAGKGGVRFVCVSGKPIGEPVAWRGPIVMNTEEELDRAFKEYRNGTFVK
jgi:redox-sensitive bicupin YhaK (pirin superfamily)